MKKKAGLRVAAVLVGMLVALVPAALLAYDTGAPKADSGIVAQATATAAPKATATAAPKAASPAAPKTGNAGLASQTGTAGVAALLIVLAVGVVGAGRVLAARRS